MKRLVFTIALMVVFCAEGAFAAPEKVTMKDSRDGKTYKTGFLSVALKTSKSALRSSARLRLAL